MSRLILMAGLLVGALLVGCSNDHSPQSPSSPALIAVSPVNGATGVPADAGVTLTFSGPVDRERLQRDMHLISTASITDSVCPLGWSHPDMDHCMGDFTMMGHFDQYHSTAGSYSWSGAGTICRFQPANSMTPQTQYMVHVGSGAMDMMGGSSHGMMDDHGSGTGTGGMNLHFTTASSSGR